MAPKRKLVIPGDPVPKGRVRGTIETNADGEIEQRFRTPAATRHYEDKIRRAFVQAYPQWRPTAGPVWVSAGAFVAPLEDADTAHEHPADADNFLKTAMDAVRGKIYIDDSQAIDVKGAKRVSDNPRLEITWQELPDDQDENQ